MDRIYDSKENLLWAQPCFTMMRSYIWLSSAYARRNPMSRLAPSPKEEETDFKMKHDILNKDVWMLEMVQNFILSAHRFSKCLRL